MHPCCSDGAGSNPQAQAFALNSVFNHQVFSRCGFNSRFLKSFPKTAMNIKLDSYL